MVFLILLLLFAVNGSAVGSESDDIVSYVLQFPANYQRPLQHQAVLHQLSRCPTTASSNRVMYGSHTGPFHEANYFVHLSLQLKNGKQDHCSGVLFTSSLILTAAHCWDYSLIDGSIVYAGIKGKENVKTGVSRKVKSFVVHPDYYGLNGAAYDLAIVSVDESFPAIPGRLTAVSFANTFNIEPATWYDCQMAGSGLSFNEDSTECVDTQEKRYMSGIIIPLECCNVAGKPKGQKNPMGTLCLRNNTDGACAGDSGSGIVCKSTWNDDKMLVGVLHGGPDCCNRTTMKKLNDPIERSFIPLDITRRTWISLVSTNFNTCGSLIACPNLPPPIRSPTAVTLL